MAWYQLCRATDACFVRWEAGSPEACLPMLNSRDDAVIQTKETCFNAPRQMERAKLARKR